MRKSVFTLLAMMLLFGVMPANAQLGNILKKVKETVDAVTNTTTTQSQTGTDSTQDKVANVLSVAIPSGGTMENPLAGVLDVELVGAYGKSTSLNYGTVYLVFKAKMIANKTSAGFGGSVRNVASVAVDQDDDFPAVRDGLDTDRERSAGHLADVVVEEAGVHDLRVVGERLLAGPGGKRAEGLVEGDVSIGPDSTQEEVDASDRGDLVLIPLALGGKVLGVAVEDVYVLGGDVDVVEEVAMHERPVALGMALGQSDIFVHVERDDVPERDIALLVQPDQLLVCSDR